MSINAHIYSRTNKINILFSYFQDVGSHMKVLLKMCIKFEIHYLVIYLLGRAGPA